MPSRLAHLNERYQVRIRNTICPKVGLLKQRGTLDHEASRRRPSGW